MKHDSTITIKADTNNSTTSIKLEPEKGVSKISNCSFQFFGKKTIANETKAGDIIEHNDAQASESTTIENYEREKMLQGIPVKPNNYDSIENQLIHLSNDRDNKPSSIPPQFLGPPYPTDTTNSNQYSNYQS